MVNNLRRLIFNTLWTTPLIASVSLPAHAQTSLCSMSDLVGTWQFISSTHSIPALNPTFTLFADGTTSDSASLWSVVGTVFFLNQDISDYSFTAPLTINCDSLSGTSISAFTFPPFNDPENGTWVAERII